ncbi:hypothetical protein [Phormidium tenue]|uniref:Porin n=1 Tax=Phormidium tenue NIES-30 TaxID=549789 RepID=A0A1U7IYM0_9CYAN|nr:hypothetical protein [Phormidium tenue]MBD2234770.1 hypothetical protein [Phormidium tenue FACHB-1052]OKH43867.1 hypothetical protein NIES30_24000 [Phormidium tenue NIES-30]
MVKRHSPIPLALISFGLLCSGILPDRARADQLSPSTAPAAKVELMTSTPSEAAAVPMPPLSGLPFASGGLTVTLAPAPEGEPAEESAAEPLSVNPAVSSPAIAPDQALVTDTYLTTAAALTPPSLPAPASLAQTVPPADPTGQDPELGVIQVRSLLEDNDLGILRIRDQPQIPVAPPRPPAKIGFFSARLAIANSDNILLAVNDVGGLTGDTFLRPSIGFGVYPALGPQTALIATADYGLQRYTAQSSLNYDDLRLRVGLRQGLTPRSYGQLIFTYQELYRPGANRERFFKNTALGLTLGRRDPITPKLALDTYYLLQFNGAQSTSSGTATDFSRFFQSAGGYLGYDITPNLQAGISYQLNFIDYTTQDRYDTFQQVLGQVVYRISPNLRFNVYGGVSFGRSSEPRVRFNDTFFGAAIDATIPLF